mgnify:CR=1 FL=1
MSTEKVSVPYDDGHMEFDIPSEQFLGTFTPKSIDPVEDPEKEIQQAMLSPIGTGRLEELVDEEDSVALIACDITRNAKDEIVVPTIVNRLNEVGIPDDQITIVVATGTHRPNTESELKEMYGAEIVERVEVINNDAYDEDSLLRLGSTDTSDIPVKINERVASADFRIATGVIEPHPFAGYSGGRKTMTIGTASEETIAATHNVEIMSHPDTQFGSIENNIFREFLRESADFVDVDFIVNVVLNEHKELLHVVAGDPDEAHGSGVDFARDLYEVPVEEKADIVISAPGMPKERNLYQATRAAYPPIINPRPSMGEGGVAIVPASCHDGLGHEGWLDWMSDVDGPNDIIRKGREAGIKPGEHKAFVIGMLLSSEYTCSRNVNIIVVGSDIEDEVLEQLCFIPADTPAEALEKANRITDNGKVFALPYGMITIPYYEE